MKRRLLISFAFFALTAGAFCGDKNPGGSMILTWPNESTPVLRFIFSKFKEGPAVTGHRALTSDVEVENTWGHPIRSAMFSLYLFDKVGERIGEATVTVSNLEAGQKAKMSVYASSIGAPATMRLVPITVPPEL